jgi:hypothetical protein
MKTKFITIALIAITCITSQLFAQETTTLKTRTKSNQTNERTAGYDLKKNVKCRVSTTETGYSIAFEYDVKSPRDVATGQSSGKRGYDYYQAKSEFSVNSTDNSVSEVKSPRDAASGLPTGKRLHKPITITKEMDKSSPKLAESILSSSVNADGASGKASFKEFTITKRCGEVITKYTLVAGECVIPTDDCPNGVCTLTAEWSWGMSNSNSSNTGTVLTGMSSSSVDFFLKIEDGVCTAMAINEKGLPGEKKPKKTTTNNPK